MVILGTMDDRTRTLVVTTIVLLIILALIAGVIFYISKIIRTRQQGSVIQNSPKGTITIVSPSPSAESSDESFVPASAQPIPANSKVYNGTGFIFYYPNNWGLLTCSNSQNFELDPTNSKDQLKVNCDVAQKPITVLVGGGNCKGQQMEKGGVTFTKSKTDIQNGTDYAYCTKTTPALEITHRVSSTSSRATSKEDFSSQIEEMISKIRFNGSL